MNNANFAKWTDPHAKKYLTVTNTTHRLVRVEILFAMRRMAWNALTQNAKARCRRLGADHNNVLSNKHGEDATVKT